MINTVQLAYYHFTSRFMLGKVYLNMDGKTHDVSLNYERGAQPLYPTFICIENGVEIFRFSTYNAHMLGEYMMQVERYGKSDVTIFTPYANEVNIEEDECY